MYPPNKPRNLTYQKCPAIVVEHVWKAKLLDDDRHHHLEISACQLWVYMYRYSRIYGFIPSPIWQYVSGIEVAS